MIHNIIFDFGNVLLDLDLTAFERKMEQLFKGDYKSAKKRLQKERIFELYEMGGLSTSEFVDKLRFALDPPLTTEQIELAWNAMLLGMPQHRFEMLQRLRRQYKVFLLSNINDLHERWIYDYMVREHGFHHYERLHFDGVYFSHLIRLRKPTSEIFEYVLADAELQPEQTVFFDDLPENVEAARLVGIQAVWHEPGTEIEERLVEMGLLPRLG